MQVSADRPWRDAEQRGRRIGVQVEQHPELEHLALPERKRPDRCYQGPVEAQVHRVLEPAAVEARPRCRVVHRQLPPTTPPPGHVGVQGGPHHPGPWHGVLADLAPGQPGPGERLRHQVLSELPVADVQQHHAQAVVPGGGVELDEFLPSPLHTPRTHEGPGPFTCTTTESRKHRPRVVGRDRRAHGWPRSAPPHGSSRHYRVSDPGGPRWCPTGGPSTRRAQQRRDDAVARGAPRGRRRPAPRSGEPAAAHGAHAVAPTSRPAVVSARFAWTASTSALTPLTMQ